MPVLQVTRPAAAPVEAILVVEDDTALRETIVDVLETEGYIVQAAKNGREALTRLLQLPKPCLVLLDLMMPVMGGKELLDLMLQDSLLAAIPVLIVSSASEGLDLGGAKAVVKKPVSLDLLLSLVHQFADNSIVT